jgi:hypothetical protein
VAAPGAPIFRSLPPRFRRVVLKFGRSVVGRTREWHGLGGMSALPPTTDIHRVDTRSEHPLRERVRPCCAAKHAWIASTAIAICGPTSSTVSASSVDVGGSIPSPPPPPGRVMRAYQTTGHLPVAVAHAFVLIRPTSGVVTSAHAICGLIPTPRGCHGFRR